MKKKQRTKNKGNRGTPRAKNESPAIHFREHLKSQDPEIRDAALQRLRQADMVAVVDSKGPRALLIVADKVDDHGDTLTFADDAKEVVVQVDDAQADEPADESLQQIEELRKLVEDAKGPWKFFGDLTDPDEEPRFMFTYKGIVHGREDGDVRGPVFARTRHAAKQYVASVEMEHGVKLVIADIQAVARQSFRQVLAQALLTGAKWYFVINPCDQGESCIKMESIEDVVHTVDGWIVRPSDTELPQYTFTHDEDTLCYKDGSKLGPFLAYTREVAERFVAETERRNGLKLAILDIRADSDMTVAELLNTALAEPEMNCAFVIRSVAEDGEIQSDVIYPETLPAE